EKQTNYRFLYNNELKEMKDKVSINVENAPLEEALNLILHRTRLLYQMMENNLVVIKENPNAPVDVSVTGKVLGEGGVPLAGASVQVKSSTIGTTTNNEGVFSLTVPDANVTLVISSIGYEEQEVLLDGRTDVSITLVPATKIMDQVVVIGYGSS